MTKSRLTGTFCSTHFLFPLSLKWPRKYIKCTSVLKPTVIFASPVLFQKWKVTAKNIVIFFPCPLSLLWSTVVYQPFHQPDTMDLQMMSCIYKVPSVLWRKKIVHFFSFPRWSFEIPGSLSYLLFFLVWSFICEQ